MQHLNYEEKLYFCNGFLHSESQKPVYKNPLVSKKIGQHLYII